MDTQSIILPTELCLKILYEFKGLTTPSAIVMREFIDEMKSLKTNKIEALLYERDKKEKTAEEIELDESDPEYYSDRLFDFNNYDFLEFVIRESNHFKRLYCYGCDSQMWRNLLKCSYCLESESEEEEDDWDEDDDYYAERYESCNFNCFRKKFDNVINFINEYKP